MEELTLYVTTEKREEVIDKLIQFVIDEFEGVEVTAIFTRRLFQEAISRVEELSLETSLKSLIK
ncbi:hypothetical protein [Clostridium ihumii]|uniref:hypothetical protein n=1 Tax=Clostridium ihumii TaxID=1470356 RepID=UPI00058BC6CD|nr:hypothetical protein [Clostridium ihumii]